MAYLRSPAGTRITGTLETVPGTCGITDEIGRNFDGTFNIDFDGTGTDICWDAQETVMREGQRVFVDADGTEFLERTLELVEGDPDDEDE